MGKSPAAAPAGTLGTFAGVFTPSILTILGIILFLRMGYVVGAAGLALALVMILISNAISILTSLSLSAIATNLKIKGGGDYYVISRTLGVEYGGALGIVLFLAQSVSIAFYSIGFGEAMQALIQGPSWLPQAIAAGAIGGLFLLAWLGADWATRFQYVVMAVLVTAIIAFFVGAIPLWDQATLMGNLQATPVETAEGTFTNLPFWTIFAIFFPAVTGFTQGVSMSGDLRDPSRSLPTGTFLAVGISMVVYLAVAVVFAGALNGTDLVFDYGAMRRIAWQPWLVDAGVIAATLSSALSSFLGAPRILQSLARDKVFPLLNPFAAGVGETENPRRAVLLSLIIALVTVALGNLNLIAPVVSMFFLISYGLLNYATYFEARGNSPSFRPTFRFFHARLSLLGAVACGAVMLAINATAAVISVALLFGIFQYIRHKAAVDRWADSERSNRFQRVRDNLHAISGDLAHPRDWRPVILAFSDNPDRRGRLLRFAQWLEGRAGFTTAVQILEGDGPTARKLHDEAEARLRADINREELSAFAKVIVTEDPKSALPVLLQSHGLGRIRVNTVLFNWYDPEHQRPEHLEAGGQELRRALRFGCNVLLLSAKPEDIQRVKDQEPSDRRIDIWYRNNATGKLMLLLAYLMKRSPLWESAKIRLLVPRSRDLDDEQNLKGVAAMLDDVRIKAEPKLVDRCEPKELMHHSLDASCVFLPFRLTEAGPQGVWGDALRAVLDPLGLTAMVLASQELELVSAPEEGQHQAIREAIDARDAAEKQVERIERERKELLGESSDALGRLQAARDNGGEEAELKALEKKIDDLDTQIAERGRRLAKVTAKAKTAREEADTLIKASKQIQDENPPAEPSAEPSADD